MEVKKEEEEEVKEEVGRQGSDFLLFLLSNGTVVEGPSTTHPLTF